MAHHDCGGECWRQIPRAPQYSVSCLGRVRNDLTGCVLRPGLQASGHLLVNLGTGRGRKSYYVHRMAHEAFVGPIPSGLYVRHYNDVPGDNRLANLELGTPKQNSEDRRRNGTHGNKLSEAEAREILALRAQGLTYKAIAARVRVTKAQVCHICTGRCWPHLQAA